MIAQLTDHKDAVIVLSSLQVDNQVANIGNDINPRFSWLIESTRRGISQTSYQILVSEPQASNKNVWDSGVVTSSQSRLIEYAGLTLTPNTTYSWTVHIVAPAGSGSASSEFTTGFLDSSKRSNLQLRQTALTLPATLVDAFRKALWIWTLETGLPNVPAGDRAFRRTFATPTGKVATSALVLLTVDNKFSFYVNGFLVGSSPNGTEWQNSQTYSVTLAPQSNLFAIRGVNLPTDDGGPSPAAVLATIQITFSDGTSTILSSDSTWLSIKAVPTNFESPALDDSQWVGATVVAQYGTNIWASDVQVPKNAAHITTLPVPTSSTASTASTVSTASTASTATTFSTTFSTPTSSTAGNNSTKESKPVGPIAGGIIGGIFVLLLIVLAFLWRQRRARRRAVTRELSPS
jgi:alpha-L-rhamnosidase